jgi:ATP-binding cassette subfamily C protein
MDNETQSIVSDSLAQLNVTRVVIAQRLSTVIKADKIYVIDAGRVVETGNYQTLMAQNGLFASMTRRQLA